MKEHSALYKWFWYRPLFRHLRPRIMTMVMALVLPLSLMCILIAVGAVVQQSRLLNEMWRNGVSSVLEKQEIRFEYEEIDPTERFPEALAMPLRVFYRVWENGSFRENNGGKVYVLLDENQVYLIHPDGTFEPASESYEAISQAKQLFCWQSEQYGYEVMVAFPYSFTVRYLPAWFWIALALAALTLLLCPVLYKRLKRDVLEPMDVMNEAMESYGHDASYRIPPQPERNADDFLKLFDNFNEMAQEVQSSHEKDIKLLETEMDNLRLQVNPHMLLNSYNMIFALAESRNYATIQEYSLCLVDYFRYVLRRGQQLVTLKQELDFVENFIQIQRIRFPGRFSYIYQAPEDCLNAMIPPLLIENFVENAIKYALKPEEAIEIVVSCHREETDAGEQMLHIAVMDTGSGIRPEVLEKLKMHEPYVDEAGHRHIGIYNCVRRIELFYGEKGDIHFTSREGQGTQAYMIIPCVYEEKAEKEAKT